jgi:hypothetical protein
MFQRITANGVKGGLYQNVRKNTNYNSPVVGKEEGSWPLLLVSANGLVQTSALEIYDAMSDAQAGLQQVLSQSPLDQR